MERWAIVTFGSVLPRTFLPSCQQPSLDVVAVDANVVLVVVVVACRVRWLEQIWGDSSGVAWEIASGCGACRIFGTAGRPDEDWRSDGGAVLRPAAETDCSDGSYFPCHRTAWDCSGRCCCLAHLRRTGGRPLSHPLLPGFGVALEEAEERRDGASVPCGSCGGSGNSAALWCLCVEHHCCCCWWCDCLQQQQQQNQHQQQQQQQQQHHHHHCFLRCVVECRSRAVVWDSTTFAYCCCCCCCCWTTMVLLPPCAGDSW